MFLHREAALFGNDVLAALDFRVEEFFDLPALQADEMVVVSALVELEDGFAGLEVMPLDQARHCWQTCWSWWPPLLSSRRGLPDSS